MNNIRKDEKVAKGMAGEDINGCMDAGIEVIGEDTVGAGVNGSLSCRSVDER